MVIGILSRNPGLYSTQSLAIAGRKKNHRVLVLDPYHCTQFILGGKPVLHYSSKPLIGLDAVIPRIGATSTDIGASVIDHFIAMGVYSTATSEALLKARNKWSCSQFLAAHGLPIPEACIYFNPESNEKILKRFRYPVIIKLIKSTQGLGVLKANHKEQAMNILEAFQRIDEQVIVQEFISEVKGSDIRIIVIDGKVEGAMKRQAKKGEFRSNLHQGAIARPVKLYPEEEQLAIRTAQLLGLDVAGVDLLRSDRGPLILEVNASPGLEGIEQTTKSSISDKIIELIERRLHIGWKEKS